MTQVRCAFQIDRLVIGGSGGRFPGFLGALYKLRPHIKNTRHFVGVSAGSLISTLLAMGCTAKQIMLQEKVLPFRLHFHWIVLAIWQFFRYGNGLIPNSELRSYITSVLEH